VADSYMKMATSLSAVCAIVFLVLMIARYFSAGQSVRLRPMYHAWNTAEVFLFCFFFLILDACSIEICSKPVVKSVLVPQKILAENHPQQFDGLLGGLSTANSHIQKEKIVVRLWARIFAAACIVVIMGIRTKWRSLTWPHVFLACFSWFILVPAVLLINVIASYLTSLSAVPDAHELTQIGTNLRIAPLFMLSACVATPIFEEWLFRGLLLSWAVRNVKRSLSLIVLSAIFLSLSLKRFYIGPTIFFAVLAFGFLAIMVVWSRSVHARNLHRARFLQYFAAVYSTSVLFAIAHPVWPTPIPLFIFAMGLGWLAVRTGGVAVPIIVHGLLNAVSTLFVLSGGAI
jgi:membrane protease YdiL (CAAX protease family)